MTKIPDSLLSITSILMHILIVPVFFLTFVLFYESQWMVDFIGMGGDLLIFNTLMLTAILIVVISGSRICQTVLRSRLQLSWWQYTLWSLTELIVFICFAALYMALMYGDYGYFPAIGKCTKIAFTTLPYPYIVLALLIAYIRPNETIHEEQLIRFTESTGKLKLVIASDVLLYIEAQENYVKVHYLEGDNVKEYSLRQSMRGIEELMSRHGIVRCQRSFFVNPRHVTVLRKDKEGIIQAELDVKGSKTVPVSPKYYDQLSNLL